MYYQFKWKEITIYRGVPVIPDSVRYFITEIAIWEILLNMSQFMCPLRAFAVSNLCISSLLLYFPIYEFIPQFLFVIPLKFPLWVVFWIMYPLLGVSCVSKFRCCYEWAPKEMGPRTVAGRHIRRFQLRVSPWYYVNSGCNQNVTLTVCRAPRRRGSLNA